MRYLRTIVGVFLAATAAVTLGIFVFGEWLSKVPKYWAEVFGLAPTTLHISIWVILGLLVIRFFGDIQRAGARYERTPKAKNLLFVHKTFLFILFVLLYLAGYGFLENLWGNWIRDLSVDYGVIVIPLGYLIVGVLPPFILGYRSRRRKAPAGSPAKGMSGLLGICSDNPIRTAKEDRLGRGKFVDRIYKIIDDFEGPESLVIGMNGGWGDGKTSVLHLLKEKISKQRNELIIVDFNPWYFNDETILIREFFKSIALALGHSYPIPDLNKRIKSVVRLLQATTANVGPIGISLGRLSISNALDAGAIDEIGDLKENLREILANMNKKVLILIDDIDRVGPEEFRLILKLVRLCADFPKFIYVLSFDRKVASDLLDKANVSEPTSFLEKIVQINLRLPQAEKGKIDALLGEWLDELFVNLRIALSKDEEQKLRNLYSNHITQQIQNLRYAKRLIAALTGTLGEIKGEVNIVDAIGLEALRIFAPPLWEDISRAKGFYVLPLGPLYFTPRVLAVGGEENKQLQRVQKHLKPLLGEEDTDYWKFAKGVLEFLFPAAHAALRGQTPSYEHLQAEYEREQRVALWHYLEKYLQQQVPLGVVSDQQMAVLIEDVSKSPDRDKSREIIVLAFADHQERDLLYDFIQKLIYLVPELNEAGDDATLKAIYESSDRFSVIERGWLDSEMDRARALLYAIANKYRSSEKIQYVLRDAILTSKSMYFASSIIIWCTPEHNHIIQDFQNIDLAGLKQAYKERFKNDYVEQMKDIFATDPNAVRYLLYPVEDSALITSYMLSLFEKHPGYIGKFLLLYATDRHLSRGRPSWGFQYKDLKTKFEIEKLYEYVKAHKDEAYENDDEKWAAERFLKEYGEEKLRKQDSGNDKSHSG